MKIAIFPGSFDPITNGHLDIVKEGLKLFDIVILLVADNENKKSRFTTEQRLLMAKEAVKDIKGAVVDSTHGLTVDFAKKVGTHYLIRGIRNDADATYEKNYEDLTHQLDKSIEFIYIKAKPEHVGISSTLIEKMVGEGKDISALVPNSVMEMYKKR